MRVLIYVEELNWTGGADLLINIIEALGVQEETKLDIVLGFSKPKAKPTLFQRLRFVTSLALRGELRKRITQNRLKASNIKFDETAEPSKISHKKFDIKNYLLEHFGQNTFPILYFDSYDVQKLEWTLNDSNIDVVLPILSNRFVDSKNIRWVGYVFDYVFKYLPHLYTEKFCFETDIMFSKNLLSAKAIIVNSNQTKKDIVKFHPYMSDSKVFALPFAPFVSVELYLQSFHDTSVLSKYGVTEHQYFIISNQLWLHKNHEVVFNALAKITTPSSQLKLICTGTTTDLSGNNNRLIELESLAKKLNISVDFVGFIPRTDQIQLICKSICLIQPTLFEGGPGGGAVYLGVALKKDILLSDIDINREIPSTDVITYFNPHDADDLANKMLLMYNQERRYQQLSKDALNLNNKAALKNLGNELVRAIKLATSSESLN